MFEQKHALRSGMVKNWADTKIVSAQFYSFSYLQLKCLKEDNEMAVLQCCWCCPVLWFFVPYLHPVAFFSISAQSAALCCTLASCLHDSGYF